MKKYIVPIALLSLLSLASCDKVHQCKCVKTDLPDDVTETEMIFEVDGSISCDGITEMSYEEPNPSNPNLLHHVNVHPVKCRDYGN